MTSDNETKQLQTRESFEPLFPEPIKDPNIFKDYTKNFNSGVSLNHYTKIFKISITHSTIFNIEKLISDKYIRISQNDFFFF